MEEKTIEKSATALDTTAEKQGHENAVGDNHGVRRDSVQTHPQPTSDALDPLNWTSWRKHSILAVVCFKYWLFTYITTTT